jgi:acetyltransferase-like isoleucine patch superfamily enzyme
MIKRYGILGSFRLLISLVYTKILYKKARLIRLPFDVRNRENIDFGRGLTTGFGCRIEAFPLDNSSNKIIKFGQNIEINDYVHIAACEKVIIGNYVLIASKVFISDINHGNYKNNNQDSPLVKPNDRKLSTSPIVINDNVWIGEGVCILPGVTIGFGSIIGALSIVTKDIPEYSIAVGAPAEVIKKYNFDTKEWIAVK